MSIGWIKGGRVTPSCWALLRAMIMMSRPLPKNILLAPLTPILKASQMVTSPLDSVEKESVSKIPSLTNLLMLYL